MLYSDRQPRSSEGEDPFVNQLALGLTRQHITKLQVLATIADIEPGTDRPTLGEVARMCIDAVADAKAAEPDFPEKLESYHAELDTLLPNPLSDPLFDNSDTLQPRLPIRYYRR